MKDIDCQVFGDQLDSLQDGILPAEGQRHLRLHAASCPECAIALKVSEHLTLPSLEELEEAVPADLLTGVWPGVEAGLEWSETPAETPSYLPRAGWLVPTLAAASVALLFSTGFLFSEVKKAETRGSRLAAQIESLQREVTENDANAEWIQRTARLAGNRRNRARALDFALAGQESVTVGALVELLEGYPEDMVLFKASRVDNLLGAPARPAPELRELLSALGGSFATLDETREVRAGELAKWLATSGLPRDLMVPKTPLIELLS